MTFPEPVYVSITGLRVTGLLAQLRFWRHAIPAMIQARRAPGNLLAEAHHRRHPPHPDHLGK